ncbi:cohesin domain-containing protein [Halonotius sp. F2-221B]|uniref:cohesin domain-containing protein n=1 Tax=Halonotius sp. F2-221B TaxID=2731620 RepID=UPI00398AA648
MSKITVRRSTFVLIAVVLLFGGTMCATSVSAQSADGEIAVSPTEVSLAQGESQTIAVTYERVSDATPQGIEYTVAYDPAVISVTNQEQGSYLGGDALINNVSSPGEVEYAEVALDGDSVETANGTVATITVEAASDVDDGATTPLELTTAKASEGSTEFTITTTNGTVEAEVPTQEEGSTDTDSDGEETTDGDSDSEETTDEDADSEETTEENADTEETRDDTENDSNRTEKVDNSTAEKETRTEAELNETVDTETSSSTASEQSANDSSTGDGTPSEDDTSGSIPGFGVKLSLIAVLAISYIVGRKTH